MGAAQGLGDDLVHQGMLLELVRGDGHGLRRQVGLVGAAPEDGGAPLGGDDGIGPVLQHQQPVADTNGQGAAGAALAHHGADDRGAQMGHDHQVVGDGLALATLLGADPRIGPGGIDKGEDGQPEALRQFHQAQGLAVALRARHPEVTEDLLLSVPPLLVTDDHDRAPRQPRHAADDGRVVGEGPIPVQFLEAGEDPRHIVQGVGSLGMAGELRDLPGGQRGEGALGEGATLGLEALDFLADVDGAVVAHQPQFLDLGLELGDGLFKFEKVEIHDPGTAGKYRFILIKIGQGRQG